LGSFHGFTQNFGFSHGFPRNLGGFHGFTQEFEIFPWFSPKVSDNPRPVGQGTAGGKGKV
jgi:hypothetical protein